MTDEHKPAPQGAPELTPTGALKAKLIGEFSFEREALDENDEYVVEKIIVPWTTIKEIMAALKTEQGEG